MFLKCNRQSSHSKKSLGGRMFLSSLNSALDFLSWWAKEALCYIVIRPRYYLAVSIWIVFLFLYLQAPLALAPLKEFDAVGVEILLLPIGFALGYAACRHYSRKERIKLDTEYYVQKAIRLRKSRCEDSYDSNCEPTPESVVDANQYPSSQPKQDMTS